MHVRYWQAPVHAMHRLGKGSGYKGSKLPEKPLVYWGYESSPFCKVSWVPGRHLGLGALYEHRCRQYASRFS